MTRKKQTSRKPKAKKAVHKKSEFSIDRLQHPNQKQHGGDGSPNRYLYGKSTTPSAKHTKRKGKQQQQNGKKKGGPPSKSRGKKNKYEAKLPIVDGNSKPVPWWRKEASQQLSKQQKQQQRKGQPKEDTKKNGRQQPAVVKLLNGALTANEASLQHLNAELQEFGKYVRLSTVEHDAAMLYLVGMLQPIDGEF